MYKILQPYNTLEELISNVDLGTLVSATYGNALQSWLNEHLYSEQAHALNRDRINELDADEVRLALCEELSIDLMSLSDYDTRAIERALARRRKKIMYIDFDAGDPDGEIAEDQAQLMKLMRRDDCKVIYLCGGAFQIPLSKNPMTYIGRDGAVINVVSRQPVSFDKAGIIFRDVTLCLQYLTPDKVELNNSTNVRFVMIKRVALDESIRQHEIYAFLQGRDAFESFEAFASRAERMRGIVVGDVLLDKADFDINRNVFELRPRWRVDFLKPIKKFARDKYFSFFVDAGNAEKIYEVERKQLLYADFGTDGGDAAIKVLFLQTETVGRILLLLTDKPPDIEFDARTSGTSGSGGAGYGLNLIAEFKEGVRDQ